MSHATAPEEQSHDRCRRHALLDGWLDRLLAHPRTLQALSVLLGLALIGLSVRPMIASRASAASAPTMVAPEPRGAADEQAALAVVAAYNQASIAAAALGRADVMAPYLAQDGPAWAQVRAEYERRAGRGEAHAPALTRWGILSVVVDGDHATVETQEQWDDITSIGGQVVSSQRGILTHNTYTLRRAVASGPWQIVAVSSTVVVG